MTREIREITQADRTWVVETLEKRWESTQVVSLGRVHHAGRLPGFIFWEDNSRLGLLTYLIAEDECEIVTLDSLEGGRGIGTSLIEAISAKAIQSDCHRLKVLTTNDNLPALRFYQQRGFRICEVIPGGVEESRNLKPSIPEIGYEGIPIRDEIILELKL